MTVSRVINGEASVRDQTRDRVNASIAALNYAPSPAARRWPGVKIRKLPSYIQTLPRHISLNF
jgi:DNA-binding LacI/PurR family transcriptional regulator